MKQVTVVHPDFEMLRHFIEQLPHRFLREGTVIYTARNELRLFRVGLFELVVKSYRRPNLVNRIAYGWLRPSKAERAYRYGLKLRDAGFDTPTPVGFVTCRHGWLLGKSYSVSLKSSLPYTYRDISSRPTHRQHEILTAIALFTAGLHEAGILHRDYSGGNILFDDEPVPIRVELVDLNRILFSAHPIDIKAGCRNFERLTGVESALALMGRVYAEARGFDPERCIRMIETYAAAEVKARQQRRSTVRQLK